jgi:L-aminopeptidase/D-esterase-like protein
MKEIKIPDKKFRIGHAQDSAAKTGCTVFLFPDGAVAAVDVAGGAPGTHETDTLRPGNLVDRIHAVVFTGGSAFGLASVQGVMEYLKQKKIGFDAGGFTVPIVPAAVIFDLPVSEGHYPDPEMGKTAVRNASQIVKIGKVGAGTGATVGKILGYDHCSPGGFGGYIHFFSPSEWVAGFAVVNALGDVIDPTNGRIVAGAGNANGDFINTRQFFLDGRFESPMAAQNTTLVLIATNLNLNREQCIRVAKMAQDGLARVIRPAHTLYDGDVVFAVSLQGQPLQLDVSCIGEAAAYCTEKAVLSVFV